MDIEIAKVWIKDAVDFITNAKDLIIEGGKALNNLALATLVISTDK